MNCRDAADPVFGSAAHRSPPGAARLPGGSESRVDQSAAGSWLCPHCRHARRRGILYAAAAPRRIRGVRLVAPFSGGCGFGHGSHHRRLAVAQCRARQRALCGAGQHGGADYRRVFVAGTDFQAGVPRRFSLADCTRRVFDRRRTPGRHCDAERYVRHRHDFPLLAGSTVADLRWPVAAAFSYACAVRFCGKRYIARQSLRAALAPVVGCRGADDRGEQCVAPGRPRRCGGRSDRGRISIDSTASGELERSSVAAAGGWIVFCDDYRAKRGDIAGLRPALRRASRHQC